MTVFPTRKTKQNPLAQALLRNSSYPFPELSYPLGTPYRKTDE